MSYQETSGRGASREMAWVWVLRGFICAQVKFIPAGSGVFLGGGSCCVISVLV